MPIFISYSQTDSKFVEALARNLVDARHHVWMDRWELGIGDSLIQKIQAALTDSSAILFVLSKASVASEWCTRELTAGLVRELEEKRTVVMPCVIEDCEIPLFLRDKLYADSRTDPDAALDLINRSLARISNPYQGRVENPTFHTDWSVDWTSDKDAKWQFRWTFVNHGHDWPYVVLSQCVVSCDEAARGKFAAAHETGEVDQYIRSVLKTIVSELDAKPLSGQIDDQFEKSVDWELTEPEGSTYHIMYTYRRLGEDNGMTTIVYLDNNLRLAFEHLESVTAQPSE